MIIANSLQLLLILILLILMLKTKERTIERPRTGILLKEDGMLYEQLENGVERTISYGNFPMSNTNQEAMTMMKKFEE